MFCLLSPFSRKDPSLLFFVFLCCGLLLPLPSRGKENLHQRIQDYRSSSDWEKARILKGLKKAFPHPSLNILKEAFSPSISPIPQGYFFRKTPGGEEVNYYSPFPLKASEKKPLVILLHPFGGSALSMIERWKTLAKDGHFFVAALSSLNDQWSSEDPARLLRVVAYSIKNLPVKEVYLLGEKEGAQGALFFGLQSPHLWKGVICWGGSPLREKGSLNELFIGNGASLPLFWVYFYPLPSIFQDQLKVLQEKQFPLAVFSGDSKNPPVLSQALLSWIIKTSSRKKRVYPLGFSFLMNRGDFSVHQYLQVKKWSAEARGTLRWEGRQIHLDGRGYQEVEIFLNSEVVSSLDKAITIWFKGKKLGDFTPHPLSWKRILELQKLYWNHPFGLFTHSVKISLPSVGPSREWEGQLGHSDPLVRWKTLRTIRLKGLVKLLPQVEERLRDPRVEVRQEAALTLGKLGCHPFVLLRALGDSSPLVRQALLRSLSFSAQKGRYFSFFSSALRDPSPQVRSEAVRVLGTLDKSVERKPYLLQICRDSSPLVRRECAYAVRDEKSLELLEYLLGDSHWTVREAAAQALGKIGHLRSLALLKRVGQDSQREVRKRAALSLRQVKLLLKGIDPMEVSLLHRKAEKSLDKGDFKEAQQIYLKILSMDSEDPTGLYNMACIESRGEKKREAFHYLIASLKAGFDNYSLLERDPDLNFLRSDARFKKILEAAKKRNWDTLAKLWPKNKMIKNKKYEKSSKSKNEKPTAKKKKTPSKEDEIY